MSSGLLGGYCAPRLCTGKCDYSKPCIRQSLHTQLPRPLPALTTLAAQEPSIRLIGDGAWPCCMPLDPPNRASAPIFQ